jgi:hypothetical protein
MFILEYQQMELEFAKVNWKTGDGINFINFCYFNSTYI